MYTGEAGEQAEARGQLSGEPGSGQPRLGVLCQGGENCWAKISMFFNFVCGIKEGKRRLDAELDINCLSMVVFTVLHINVNLKCLYFNCAFEGREWYVAKEKDNKVLAYLITFG